MIKLKDILLTEGRPRGYAEEIAQDLVKKKKVKKGMKEDKLITAIFKWLKKNDRNKNRVRWLMSYDEDFLSDTISAINSYLKEGKLKEAGSIGGMFKYGSDLGSPSGIDTGKKGGTDVNYQGFSSKEAKTVIDKELKDWAKKLRKVQGKVVKSWMSKAKSGVIDYFDLVRGLKTGDIKRAHPYETEFLFQLLNKDKIMDRFRSYFGGKKGKKRK